MRQPCVAGSFYEKDKDSLLDQLKELFLNKPGPGKIPKIGNKKNIYGIISPHAGYIYSGYCAAHGYFKLAESGSKDHIILGVNHTGLGKKISVSSEDWLTPLGTVKNNKEAGKKLDYGFDEAAHKHEHSIEVQVPFLQFIFKDDFSIVPISLSHLSFSECEELAERISKLNLTVIASSDFTHYGFGYGFIPFVNNIETNLRELDMKAVSYIQNLDAKGFYDYAKNSTTICGFIPVTVSILAVKSMGAKKAELLCNYTSADIVKSTADRVNYVSIIFT